MKWTYVSNEFSPFVLEMNSTEVVLRVSGNCYSDQFGCSNIVSRYWLSWSEHQDLLSWKLKYRLRENQSQYLPWGTINLDVHWNMKSLWFSEALKPILVYSAGAHQTGYLKYRYEFLLMNHISWASAFISRSPTFK